MFCSCFRTDRPSASRAGTLIERMMGKTFRARLSAVAGRSHYQAEGTPTLVSPAYLEAKLRDSTREVGKKKLHVLDCTWYLPNANRSAMDEFISKGRIQGAKFFDLDSIADRSTSLPHMLPSEGAFAAAMDELGISRDDEVICYDRQGIFSAPRAWWTLKVFGHTGGVSVLNGGLPEWQRVFGEGYMMEADGVEPAVVERPGEACKNYEAGTIQTYKASLQAHLVKSLADIVATYEDKNGKVVVDARPANRWKGEAPEPRKGLPSGHVPNSRNIPWDALLDTVNALEADSNGGKNGSTLAYKRFRSEDDIRRVLAEAGLDASSTDFGDVIASCGSGTTACILVLASEQLKDKRGLMSVYDGSWSEYGASGSRIESC